MLCIGRRCGTTIGLAWEWRTCGTTVMRQELKGSLPRTCPGLDREAVCFGDIIEITSSIVRTTGPDQSSSKYTTPHIIPRTSPTSSLKAPLPTILLSKPMPNTTILDSRSSRCLIALATWVASVCPSVSSSGIVPPSIVVAVSWCIGKRSEFGSSSSRSR